ncbi:MAG: hypothetical protein LBE62_01205 [Azonexus sp.]|jgi:hypothetical protein|nr:hypothetical protein [Azonexus sp.]
MTHSDSDNPAETPSVASSAAVPPPNDSRRRLRELLSIPERDRSDPQWDEIIELEIQLAPGNRISGSPSGPGGPLPQPRPGGGNNNAQKKHRPRANNNRRGRHQNKPPAGGA